MGILEPSQIEIHAFIKEDIEMCSFDSAHVGKHSFWANYPS